MIEGGEKGRKDGRTRGWKDRSKGRGEERKKGKNRRTNERVRIGIEKKNVARKITARIQ
jgi:hypothetical protein